MLYSSDMVILAARRRDICAFSVFPPGDNMIKITERAAQEVKSIITSKSLPETTILRVEVKPVEGKDELKLTLKLETRGPEPDEMVETTSGTRLAINGTVAQILGDLRLDYREDSGRFIFERPEPMA